MKDLLLSRKYYLRNIDELIRFQKQTNFKKIAFCTFKINQFSKNKKIGRVIIFNPLIY